MRLFPHVDEAVVKLGETTDTGDAEGQILESRPVSATLAQVEAALNHFKGEIEQTPPMYSAVKIDGKKLYNLARKGKSVEREPRKIFIERFDITKIDLPDIHFIITCSKGTFIRVIAYDFGKKLNTGALLTELRRIGIGNFRIEDAITIDVFSNNFQLSTAAK